MDDEVVRFTAAPGTVESLRHAGQRDEGYEFPIDGGDLSQMGTQAVFLKARGFDVGWRDVYPALRTSGEWARAIKEIWEERVDGWWNLQSALVALGACTAEEFDAALASKIEGCKNTSASG